MVPLVLCFCLILPRVEAADDLPPGVPRVVRPDGSVLFIEPLLTTREFQNEALRLVLGEANNVAKELQLPESLPITKTNLTHLFISGFGFMRLSKAVGNVTTSNYWYFVSRGYKFSQLTIANYDARCIEFEKKYQWPVSRVDTNAAYQLATQWLAAVHMDVRGLNRDCTPHIALSPYWNGVKLGEVPRGMFTPMYYLWWTPKGGKAETGGAFVELLLPTKTLLQLGVDDPRYILRKPLVFTNLAALFPGKATITTNWPVKPQYIPAPGP